jgi:hypothetical protein
MLPTGREPQRNRKEPEPLGASEPVRYYDLLRLLLTWGLWRRPQEEGDSLMRAAVASQRDAARQKEIQAMTQTLGQGYVEQGKTGT